MKSEKELIDDLMDLMKLSLKQNNTQYKTKSRPTHAKTIGLLKGQFHISKSIPSIYKLGVFESSKSFDTWIRFANASGHISTDKNKDLRSISIKLIDVKGERFINDKNSQDFLLQSYPTLGVGTLKNFRDATHYAVRYKKYGLSKFMLIFGFLFTGRFNVIKNFIKSTKTDDSLLHISYWSQTPYKLGDSIVKYILKPIEKDTMNLKQNDSDNFLKENMSKHLDTKSASFDFFIQPFINEKSTPTEDASILWDETLSKPIKIGRLEIPIQKFDTKERMRTSHNMSFDLANVLSVHEPIGGLNRARIETYYEISQMRAKKNKVELVEPTFDECA